MNVFVQPIIIAVIFMIYVFVVDNFIVPTPIDIDMNKQAIDIIMAVMAMI